MKNVSRNLNLDFGWNNNIDYGYSESHDFLDTESLKKIGIIFVAGCVFGILLAVLFAGFLYGIQPKSSENRRSYGKMFLIIIAPCILLGLIAGILLL
jgi:hypothetical protein